MAHGGIPPSWLGLDEILVGDNPEPCPYLPGRVARLPLRLQIERSAARFDRKLAEGDRRVGQLLYRPSCVGCAACVCVRVPVAEFEPSRSQRRVLRRNEDLHVVEGPPRVDSERLRLFNRHKLERSLGDAPLSRDAYEGWLVRTCADTRELAFYDDEARLLAVTILDVGARDTSAVYTYFDPGAGARSLGVLAVLTGIDWARRHGRRFHYLGLWVQDNDHLAYKANYRPQERLLGGGWVRVE